MRPFPKKGRISPQAGRSFPPAGARIKRLEPANSAPQKSVSRDSCSTSEGERHAQTKIASPVFKAKVALAALSGERTIGGTQSECGVHQTFVHNRTKQIKKSADGIFSGEVRTEEAKKGEKPFRFSDELSNANGDAKMPSSRPRFMYFQRRVIPPAECRPASKNLRPQDA